MTPEQFCYWLQGYSELGGPAPLPEQWAMIREHLALVFEKETPAMTLVTVAPVSGAKYRPSEPYPFLPPGGPVC